MPASRHAAPPGAGRRAGAGSAATALTSRRAVRRRRGGPVKFLPSPGVGPKPGGSPVAHRHINQGRGAGLAAVACTLNRGVRTPAAVCAWRVSNPRSTALSPTTAGESGGVPATPHATGLPPGPTGCPALPARLEGISSRRALALPLSTVGRWLSRATGPHPLAFPRGPYPHRRMILLPARSGPRSSMGLGPIGNTPCDLTGECGAAAWCRVIDTAIRSAPGAGPGIGHRSTRRRLGSCLTGSTPRFHYPLDLCGVVEHHAPPRAWSCARFSEPVAFRDMASCVRS